MTDREKAIVMAHTGICMLAGNKFQIFHKYVGDIMGRPIMTHELGWLGDTIKEKSKAEFIALCAEQDGRWIESEFEMSVYCSECNSEYEQEYDFCPSCGADMRGKQDG